PEGAYVDYVLKEASATPVELKILDADGALVRRYTSAEKPLEADLAKIRVAPEWTRTPVALSTAPGMHRFVWPIRYAAPTTLGEGNPYADGVWAPPGRYTLELTAGGRKLSQPLTVDPDPRLALLPEAYARQLALARKVEALRERVAAAVAEADKLHR